MKVLHINFSKSGGAGVFARDLVEAQTAAGIDARLVTLSESDLRSAPLRDPLLTLQAALDEYIVKSVNFESPISLLRRGARLPPSVLDFVPDLLHLHWVEGVVSEEWLRKVAIPIVWTLHDFRPLSGACHHPMGCDQLASGCHSCPAVKPIFRGIVKRSAASRINLSSSIEMTFVAPSKWVADVAMRSRALSGHHVSVIYNGSPNTKATPEDSQWLRAELGNDSQPLVAVSFGSSVSSLKGRDLLEPLSPDIFEGCRVVTFGAESLTWADKNLGVISRQQVAAVFSTAKLAIVPSRAETFSLATFEATRAHTVVCGVPGSAVQEIAETFGEFIPLTPNAIRVFLRAGNAKSSRLISRQMSDVVNDYQVVYQNAISPPRSE